MSTDESESIDDQPTKTQLHEPMSGGTASFQGDLEKTFIKSLPTSTVSESPPFKPLEPVKAAGLSLAKWVLMIMTATLLVFTILVGIAEWKYADHLSTNAQQLSGKEMNTQFLSAMQNEHKEFREFWLKVFQTTLVNVLLPVLTALLGYIFATKDSTGS